MVPGHERQDQDELELPLMRSNLDDPDGAAGNEKQVEGPLAVEYVKNVPIAYGIPVAPVSAGVPLVAMIIFLVLLMTIAAGMVFYVERFVVNTAIPISHNLNVTMSLRNCAVHFHPVEGDQSYVTVRYWASKNALWGWGSMDDRVLNPISFPNEDHMAIYAHMAQYDPYFQCSISMSLADGYQFRALKIKYGTGQHYMEIQSDVTIKAESINIDAHHAYITLKNLESPHVNLHIGDGNLQFEVDGPLEAYKAQEGSLVITSVNAPVSLHSSQPLKLIMNGDIGTRSLLKGEGIYVEGGEEKNSKATGLIYTGDWSYLGASDNAVPIIIKGAQASLYATARPVGQDVASTTYNAWAGIKQMEEPSFLPDSDEKMAGIEKFIQETPAAPWAVQLSLLGEYLPDGIWRFLSSDAYYGANIWFVLFTGGVLDPRRLRLKVHILGLYCRNEKEDPAFDLSEWSAKTKHSYGRSWSDVDKALNDKEVKAVQKYTEYSEISDLNETLPSVTLNSKYRYDINDDDGTEPQSYGGKMKSKIWKRDGPYRYVNRSVKQRSEQESVNLSETHEQSSTELGRRDEIAVQARSLGDNDDTPKYPGEAIGQVRPNGECMEDLLEDAFAVIYMSSHESATSSSRYVFTQREMVEWKFHLENKAVVRSKLNWKAAWAFTVAITINMTASLLIAGVAVYVIVSYVSPGLLKGIRDTMILRTSSHRLIHEISDVGGDEWNIQVARVHYPAHGFVLRWTKRKKARGFSQIGVHIRPVTSKWKTDVHKDDGDWLSAFKRFNEDEEEDISGHHPSDVFLYVPYHAGHFISLTSLT
eukprot:GHVN01074676.1.p1 GENE.GHVN01074676.1~~GHVN01074676.1.p1  ORF type:complete len:814 (-),score=139.02 GHVN01074676.1:16-2457(-)